MPRCCNTVAVPSLHCHSVPLLHLYLAVALSSKSLTLITATQQLPITLFDIFNDYLAMHYDTMYFESRIRQTLAELLFDTADLLCTITINYKNNAPTNLYIIRSSEIHH